MPNLCPSSASQRPKGGIVDERDGRTDNVEGAFLPLLLYAMPIGLVHASVIVHGLDAVFVAELFRSGLARGFRQAVHNAAFAVVLFANELGDFVEEALLLVADFVIQVGAVEGLREDDGVLETEVVDHVLLDSLVRSGREGDDWCAWEVDLQLAKVFIIGALTSLNQSNTKYEWLYVQSHVPNCSCL